MAAKGKGGWTDERSAAGGRNPWLIVSIISMATFMEVLDTSIANVSLTHIAGSLSASQDESTWVLTSYLVANAVVIPLSGWLSDVLGRKRYYMISVGLFGISSLCCGFAPNLAMLVAARIFQGMGGGGLAPSEQSILADTFPPDKRGQAFAAYGVVVVVGPVLGPTLGGWITDNFSWHWIFLINVPVAVLSLFLVHFFVTEPEVLVKEREKRWKGGLSVDYIGFIFILLGLGCLEITLDRGETDNWFASPFICTTAIVSVCSLVALMIWELNHKQPIIDLRLLGSRNFAVTTTFMVTTGAVLFGTTAILPQMLQQVFGYDATTAGLAMTTGGFATLVAMVIVGRLAGKVDTRLLLMPALALQAGALWYMSGWSTQISFHDASMGRLISAAGLPFLFIPIQTAAYVGLKPENTNDASAILNVARNLGGSFGIAITQAALIERGQFHQSRIVETLSPLNPNYVETIDRTGPALGLTDPQGPVAVLYSQVQQQAQMLSYIDVFHGFMIFVLMVIPLGLLIKQGKSAGGHG
jgi:DHA2 family multidrug resistance protein